MSDTFFDDENYHDGFDEDALQKGMDFSLWKKLLDYTLCYKKEVSILCLTAFTTGVSEIAFPMITRSVIDAVSEEGGNFNLMGHALTYFGFVLLLGLSVTTFIHFAGKIRTHVSHDIRRDGFENLQRLSFSYYDYRPVGWLMARMTSDCERLSNILAWGMLDLAWGLTMMIGISMALFWMDVSLAITVLCVLPLLVLLSIKFQRRILKSARLVRKTNSRITGSFNESIMGVRTSKAFVKEEQNLHDFDNLTTQMHHSSVLNAIQAAVYLPLVLTLASLASGLALVMGGLEVASASITTGTLIAFLTYTRHFFEPVENFAHWFAEMQMAQASAERIISLIEEQPSISDSHAVITSGIRNNTEQNQARIERIELRNVDFSYEIGPKVLKNINLDIRQGENIAIVGSTGSGKTSIISLISRFYEPTAGQILINNVDYRDQGLDWLQSRLGIVLQSSHLFSGSIMENIRYGRLEASNEEILAAARKAGADEFIQNLPEKYSTEVGEGGSRLSAGQKQLLSFSRAILADPDILIMDEATSSVDTETEQQIQQGLAALLSGRISIVIAHRLSTIRNADRIIVLEKGEIIETGSHQELIRENGRYHYLYSQQSLSGFTRDREIWR